MKRSEENGIKDSPRPQYDAVSQAPIRRAEFKEVAAPELDPLGTNIAAHYASAIGRSPSGGTYAMGAASGTGRSLSFFAIMSVTMPTRYTVRQGWTLATVSMHGLC
jgi:hypothetical protein